MSHSKASYVPAFQFNEPINQVHVINHNLNTLDPVAVVIDTATGQIIYPTNQVITANTLQLTLAEPLAIRGLIFGNS